MDVTLLLHKPVVYGSSGANLAFIAALGIHALTGAAAFVASIVALAAKKGQSLHIRAGQVFVWSMVATAATGVGLDVVRLTVNVAENHVHYPNTFMPSAYAARFAFLFASLGIFYLARFGRPLRVRRDAAPVVVPTWRRFLVPGLLVALALGLTVLLVVRYNPWGSSALWMIWTFCAASIETARRRCPDGAPTVEEHRFAMLFLAAFSWWGVVQGFGPAIGVAIKGLSATVDPYVGNLPGEFTLRWFVFGLGFAPAFVIAAVMFARFTRRARPVVAAS